MEIISVIAFILVCCLFALATAHFIIIYAKKEDVHYKNEDHLKLFNESFAKDRGDSQRLDALEKAIVRIEDDISTLKKNYAKKYIENECILDLSCKGLASLPIEIGKLTNLTAMDLRDNCITSLPSEIGNLTNLTKLLLNCNILASLPSEIGKLTNLKELRLSYNCITSLPSEIGNLTNLKELWLIGNNLTELPSEMGNLTNLKELRLVYNPIPKNKRKYYQSLLPNTRIYW